MRIILLGTGDIALKVFLKLKNDNRIEMKGVICDDSVKEEVNAEYQRQIEENGGKILSFEEESIKDADAVFTCEYRKAIPQKYVDKYMFLNCHAGILPKYRGFSANPWAIMNGEQQIGYTIHRMDEKLDNGDIYYVGKFPISYQQTYADLYDTIFDDMIDRIPGILAGIYEGTIRATKQEKRGVYCSKFNAGMGNLGNFDKPSDYIVNLHRCMARPHGTGIFFYYKGEKYYIGKITSGTDLQLENYLGIPGKIVNIESGVIWVKTRDNIVVISELLNEHGEIVKADCFRIGNQLGR